jgi:hypothetical protein
MAPHQVPMTYLQASRDHVYADGGASLDDRPLKDPKGRPGGLGVCALRALAELRRSQPIVDK